MAMFFVGQAVVLKLLGDEEPLADLDLLLLRVAGQLDDFHPVAQGRRNRIEQVARGDEEHLREVEGHLEVVVLEGVVLLRIEDLEQGRCGSPRKSMPILSTSSSMNTGLFVPAVLMFWMTRPGSAPMYVRRWPRISASSWMPPRLMRTNLRFMARATLLPSDVLPTPGGPTKARIGLRILSARVRTARYSRMRSLIFSRP